MAIGAITRTAVTSNLQSWNPGSPTQLEIAIDAKFKIAEPSGFLIPHAFIIIATA